MRYRKAVAFFPIVRSQQPIGMIGTSIELGADQLQRNDQRLQSIQALRHPPFRAFWPVDLVPTAPIFIEFDRLIEAYLYPDICRLRFQEQFVCHNEHARPSINQWRK